MGRIFRELDVCGASRWTLFDSEARSNYVVLSAASALPRTPFLKPVERRIGGETLTARESCLLVCAVDGNDISVGALVVERLFSDESGRPIEIILGAEAMELWGIGLDIFNRRLDFTHYAREATEG